MNANDLDVKLPAVQAGLGFVDDHELLQKSARRFLTERCPRSAVRRLVDEGADHDPALWKEIAELGWIGLCSAEQHGGAGLDLLYLCLLLEEMGRALLPSPFLGSMLALAALEHAGSPEQQTRHVPALLSGERTATLAFSEPGGSWEPEHVTARSEPSNGGFRLSGDKTHVLSGASADLVVVPCLDPDGSIALYAVELPAERLAVHREVCVDRTRPTARLALDRVAVPREARLEGDGLVALGAAFCRGYVLLASEMVGVAEAVLGLTRDYAIERRQFGRAIGSFQAVKHPIVDMLIGIELSRNLVLGAAAAFDQDPARFEQSARMAKAMAGQSLGFAVEKGVQLHGGFGFTWDCDVQLYFKRALWSRGTLGDATHHRRHLARTLLAQPGWDLAPTSAASS